MEVPYMCYLGIRRWEQRPLQHLGNNEFSVTTRHHFNKVILLHTCRIVQTHLLSAKVQTGKPKRVTLARRPHCHHLLWVF